MCQPYIESTTVLCDKLGYVKGGFTAFKVQKDGCGVPSAREGATRSCGIPRVT